ncbi:MAG: dethiobiotin synthase [Candidatus Omnitrophica bacterium]|nr:dethiobiotin synthase [Candidatus Omnitrophota bacterium]
MLKNKPLFITATDTGVGKTITTCVLGALLQNQGHDVGVMKPVQSAGDDAQFLKKSLGLEDDLKDINPYYAPEPLSPHWALKRAKIKFNIKHLQACLKKLQSRHEVVLIEGAGGLMVPLKDFYYNADLIADLKADLIIVARLGLGTLNHTLLTINEARRRGLKIKGLVFCQTSKASLGLPEKRNPSDIVKLSGIKLIGIIPYLKSFNRKNILRQCKNLKFKL